MIVEENVRNRRGGALSEGKGLRKRSPYIGKKRLEQSWGSDKRTIWNVGPLLARGRPGRKEWERRVAPRLNRRLR